MTTMATHSRMGIRQLRDTLTRTLRRVQEGETIEVTHHGVPVAVLAPIAQGRIERLVAAGDVTPGKPLTEAIRPQPVTGEMTASEAIEDDRAGR